MNTANAFLADRPRFRMLSDEKVYQLHLSTLELLERTGVEVNEEEALRLLGESGCHISGNRVRIPSRLVKQALNSAPERVAVRDRNGKGAVYLEDGRSNFGTGSDCPNTWDVETRERRVSVLSDVGSLARLTDRLPNLDFVMSMAIANDMPAETADVHAFVAMLSNTTKPIVFTAVSLENIKAIHAICCIVAGGEEEFRRKPFAINYSEPITPLTHAVEPIEKLLFCAEKGIPIVYTPCAMSGATSPATLAGSITLGGAESLSGLVIQQLKAPGAPFIYGAFASLMDMSTTVLTYGSPELAIMSAALAEMAHFYRLPAWGQACCTDAKVLDHQAGAEYMATALMGGLAGANLVHDMGYLESGLTSSHESIVLADEVVGFVKKILRGVQVDGDRLGLDVIDDIGPGGEFLTSEHTLKYFSEEYWFPQVFDRERYAKWEEMGSNTILEKANRVAKGILAEHEPTPLEDGKRLQIEEVLRGL